MKNFLKGLLVLAVLMALAVPALAAPPTMKDGKYLGTFGGGPNLEVIISQDGWALLVEGQPEHYVWNGTRYENLNGFYIELTKNEFGATGTYGGISGPISPVALLGPLKY